MPRNESKRWYANADLGERLRNLASFAKVGQERWVEGWLIPMFPPGERRSARWMWGLLTAQKPVPGYTMLTLIRIAEENPVMQRDQAWSLRTKWFNEFTQEEAKEK